MLTFSTQCCYDSPEYVRALTFFFNVIKLASIVSDRSHAKCAVFRFVVAFARCLVLVVQVLHDDLGGFGANYG